MYNWGGTTLQGHFLGQPDTARHRVGAFISLERCIGGRGHYGHLVDVWGTHMGMQCILCIHIYIYI